jgi:hypothetical protein
MVQAIQVCWELVLAGAAMLEFLSSPLSSNLIWFLERRSSFPSWIGCLLSSFLPVPGSRGLILHIIAACLGDLERHHRAFQAEGRH